MPRPKTISDEDVLAAALEVLAARGAAFTLADLAERIGLARATLIQRFGDREAILLRIAGFEVEATRRWLETLPVETGRDGLWQFLAGIVGSMGAGAGFSARVALAALEAQNPALRDLAQERYGLVQAAIAARLPEGPERAQTAAHLHAVIAGSTMQWVASAGATGLADFVLDRLRWSLDHLPAALLDARS